MSPPPLRARLQRLRRPRPRQQPHRARRRPRAARNRLPPIRPNAEPPARDATRSARYVPPSERTSLMTPVLANIAGPDLLIIVGIIVLLFGRSQLPKLARSLRQASKEFKKGGSSEGNHEPGRPENKNPN